MVHDTESWMNCLEEIWKTDPAGYCIQNETIYRFSNNTEGMEIFTVKLSGVTPTYSFFLMYRLLQAKWRQFSHSSLFCANECF